MYEFIVWLLTMAMWIVLGLVALILALGTLYLAARIVTKAVMSAKIEEESKWYEDIGKREEEHEGPYQGTSEEEGGSQPGE
jgi:hypothetical protein